MSKLFRAKEWLTFAQLARAWSSELAEEEQDPRECEQNLIHVLREDIVHGRLDDSGPLREGRRFGLRLVTPENRAAFIEGPQLLGLINADWDRALHHILVMKEAVFDFAQRRQLRSPSWWADAASTPTEVPTGTEVIVVKPNTGAVASRSVGKQPRILNYLRERFPGGYRPLGSAPGTR